MKLAKKSIKYFWWIVPLLISAIVTVVLLFIFDSAHAPTVPKTKFQTKQNTINSSKKISKKPNIPDFNKKKYSTTDPASIWLVVNKQHPIVPQDYVPADLVASVGATISIKAKTDFEAMNNDALAQGINFTIVSSYRSFSSQNTIYNNYLNTYGQASTDTFSARPGYSEHQTGLAVDLGSSTGAVCNLDECFGNTKEGIWLSANANDYGFIIRYSATKQSTTGYKSEPWHFRYVGKELAAEMKKQSIQTLEEFFGITGGEVYT